MASVSPPTQALLGRIMGAPEITYVKKLRFLQEKEAL